MKLMYISEFFFETNGANKLAMMHYNTIKDIVGVENVITVALTGGEELKNKYEYEFRSYCSRKEKLKNYFELNTSRINNNIVKEILKIILEKDIDTVFIDNSTYGRLVKKIKTKVPNIRVFTFYHDVKRNLCKMWLKNNGIKYLPDYFTTIYNELINAKYSDYNITLNGRESKMFEKYYHKTPNFQLPIYIKQDTSVVDKSIEEEDKIRILFVGAYYYPNVKGIEWFIQNVFNKLSDEYELYIVGREMDRLNFQDERIKVKGFVEDLGEYYRMSDFVIAPIFDGAGMKVKTAEALMYGKVFIGTEESLIGYSENISQNEILDKICLVKDEKEFLIEIDRFKREKYPKYNEDINNFFKEYYSDAMAKVLIKKYLG